LGTTHADARRGNETTTVASFRIRTVREPERRFCATRAGVTRKEEFDF
jgi:hypothetical protein